MPTYKAPVDDALFLLNDVFHLDRYGNLPGFADASPDVVEAVLREAAKFSEEVLTPLNRVGDQRRLHAPPRRQRHHADRLQGRLQATGRGRLDRHLGAGRIRRPGPAGDPDRGRSTNSSARPTWPSPCMPGLTQGAIAALLAHASPELKTKYLPKMTDRRMDRHHESDRAALRHRSRAVAHEGGEAKRRQLQDHRHQDLHLRRRARSGREHHPPGAGAHRRRARRHQGHLAVRGAEDAWSRTTARSARATASPAARSKRRWASTAIPPA